jgi:hypothetical protein
VDDFCKAFLPQCEVYLLSNGSAPRGPQLGRDPDRNRQAISGGDSRQQGLISSPSFHRTAWLWIELDFHVLHFSPAVFVAAFDG